MVRPLFIAFLVFFISLQSFAGVTMNAKMTSMSMAMAHSDPMPMPCHDCCDSQAVCQNLSQMFVLPSMPNGMQLSATAPLPPQTKLVSFHSADLALGFKPPIL